MAAFFSSYIANIAVFLIFMGFIGVILPEGKYKDYINLTLGFILVIIVTAPVIGFLGGGYSDIFADMSLNYDKNVMSLEHSSYDDAQNAMVLSAYEDGLKTQLERVVNMNGTYYFINASFMLGKDDDNFGEILSINLELSQKPKTAAKTPIIRIEPVTVGNTLPGFADSGSAGKETEEDEGIKNLRKAISDFYNIVQGNIYINVHESD